MTRSLTGILVLLLPALAPSLSCQGRELTVSGNPACPACRILLDHVVTLGRSGEPGLTRLTRVAVDSHGRFYAAPTYDPGKVVMYDARGAVTRTFGREGQGPGEFGSIIHMLRVGPGDSIYVFEGPRQTVLTPGIASLAYVRMLPLLPNDLAFLDDGRTVVHRTIMGEGRVALPLHLLDAQGRIARSFGGVGRWDPRKYYPGSRRIAPASGNRVWSAHFAAYRIELWGLDGSRLKALVRDVSWFRPWENETLTAAEEPRHPRIVDLAEDPQGRLWVSILVPDPRWRPPRSRGEVPLDEIDLNAEFDTVLEVLDPRTGHLLARTRLDQSMPEFIGNGRMLFSRREDAAGNIVIDVWRIRFSSSETRGRR